MRRKLEKSSTSTKARKISTGGAGDAVVTKKPIKPVPKAGPQYRDQTSTIDSEQKVRYAKTQHGKQIMLPVKPERDSGRDGYEYMATVNAEDDDIHIYEET